MLHTFWANKSTTVLEDIASHIQIATIWEFSHGLLQLHNYVHCGVADRHLYWRLHPFL